MSYHFEWEYSKEDTEFLDSLPGEDACMLMRGDYVEQSVDPRTILVVENQSSVGSCAGHSLSTNGEFIHWIVTGQTIQLSRAMAYYETQRIDGIRGDSGSTISGGIKLATSTGICREELWTYSGRYDNRRPSNYDAVLQDAANYKFGNAVRLKTYDGVRTWLGSGQGGIHTGLAWSSALGVAVVENYVAGRGGHSQAWISLSERKDRSGRPYVWVLGSYGKNFANKGWQEWSPSAIERSLQYSGTVLVGVSDMPNVQPREYTVQDWQEAIKWA